MKKIYSAITISPPKVILPNKVKPINYNSHVTMAIFTANKKPIISDVRGDSLWINPDLYILQGHHTKQTMIVCKVVIDSSFKTIISKFPVDESLFKRIYHVTVGTIPYDEKLENLSLYCASDSAMIHSTVTGYKLEAFNPVSY